MNMSPANRYILPGMRLLLPVLAGLAVAYLLSGVFQHHDRSGFIPGNKQAGILQDSQQQSWEKVIFNKNILSLEIPDYKPVERDLDTTSDPETWRLLATFTGAKNFAVLSADGENIVLSPGQKHTGWELSRIEPQAAVWTSGTETVTLRMWQSNDPAEKAGTISAGSNDNALSQRITLNNRDVQPILNDPNAFLQMAHFSPYEGHGEQGFEITSIRPGSILQKLGIKNRDVLTRIDGRSITGPTELLRAYSSLTQSSLVTMDILRQGQNMSFVIEIN